MRSRPERRLGGLLAALAVVVAGLAVPPGPAGAAEPTRVLLLGDSVTQGSVGDWTWRYRLWQHLRASGAGVDLVGPDDGLYDAGAGTPQAYADPAFDRDHAAGWGRFADYGRQVVGGLVGSEHPDVVVVMLGVNDLIFGQGDPSDRAAGTEDTLRRLVRNAQEADPDVEVVLGELTQTWFGRGVPELNALLPGLAAELTTPTSRVVVAHAADGYTQADSYDDSHPTATGEVLIAAAVADALAGLGVGSAYPRPLVAAPAVPRATAGLVVTSEDGLAHLAWTPPPGGTRTWVWHRDATLGEPWARQDGPVAGTALDVPVVNHHVHEFRLQSGKGTQTSELFSATVAVTPLGPEPPPVTEPVPVPVPDLLPVSGLAVHPRGRHRVEVRWRSAPGATSYDVRWWPQRHRGAERLRSSRALRLSLGGLHPDRSYRVAVRAVAGARSGPWVVRSVRTRR